jgi:Zn-dependent protease with chaperone function
MTATRIARAATLAVGAILWVLAGSLLWRTKVPTNLHLPPLDERSVFGTRLVHRAQEYERFIDITWTLGTLAALAALVWLARRGPYLARSLGLGRVNAGIVLAAVTLTVVWATSLPFGLANAWWDRRHELSTESYAAALGSTWGNLLGASVVVVLVFAGLLLLAKRFGQWWWAVTAPLLAGLFAFLQFIWPYAFTANTHPLRDSRLLTQVRQLERREHAGNPAVRVQTVSDTTRQANAYSLGIGPSERLVFWDTLLDGRFSGRQVRFVAAHELAHLARNHIAKSVGWFTLFEVPILGAAAFVTRRRGGLPNPGLVPLAMLVIGALYLASLPLQNAISRRYEAEADWVALTATRDPDAAKGLFVRFARTSLQDPSPPWWAHVLLDNHPPPLTRVEQAFAWRRLNR